MLRRILCCATLALLVWPAAGRAADEPTDDEITKARVRGIEYLKAQQQSDGSWVMKGHDVGITALCTLALLENGLAVTDPVIEKGVRFVRKNSEELTNTYELTLSILLLSRIGGREDRPLIRTHAARLLAGQLTSGGWHYSCPKVSSSVLSNKEMMPKPKDGPGDNSCTQFAVLGLWVASRGGIDIGDAMRRVADRFITHQNSDGGWSYGLPKTDTQGGAAATPQPTTPSMTFAGLFCLTVARANTIRKQGTNSSQSGERKAEGQTLMEDPVFARGLEQAGKFVQQGHAAEYYLWSAERLGVLLGLEKIGEVDWFQKGAGILLRSQLQDGGWPDDRMCASDTAFAILFLRKANLGSDISRLLEGEPEQAFQIVSRDDKPRFPTLDACLKASRAGDVIRLDGNGPYVFPNLQIDHDLTIQAGFGYAPVINFGLGGNDLGIRLRPETDPNARFLAQVNAGQLTLEGLKLQMDAPNTSQEVAWSAVSVAGGKLRILNCTISEGNRKGMAAVRVAGPGEVVIRNSVLVGGRAAVEIAAAGEQKVIVDNSILFSAKGISITGENKEAAGRVELSLTDSIVQAPVILDCAAKSAEVSVVSRSSLLKGDKLAPNFLVAAGSKQGRSFSGAGNIYDVANWLGVLGGGNAAGVTSVETWTKFWGGEEKGSTKKTLVFEGKRQQGAFSHAVRGEDFELPDKGQLAAYRNRVGARTLVLGTGENYDRYRESILYSEWKRGHLEAVTSLDQAAAEADATKK